MQSLILQWTVVCSKLERPTIGAISYFVLASDASTNTPRKITSNSQFDNKLFLRASAVAGSPLCGALDNIDYNIDIANYLAIWAGYNIDIDIDYNIDIAGYPAIRAG